MRVKSALALKFNQGVAHIARTADGDLLVGSCLEPVLRVFSPDGKPIGGFRLEPGRWGIEVDARMRHFAFTDGGLFAFVEDKDAADSTLRIIRVDPPGGND